MKKIIAILLIMTMVLTLFCSCKKERINKSLNLSDEITLRICGPWPDSKAIEGVSLAFSKKYPNCNVEYEYVQNYGESLIKRLDKSPESIDLFLTENIQGDSSLLPYTEDLFSHTELKLSDTNDALIKNFTLINTDKSTKNQIYSIPFGGELRGLYVNKTLLDSVCIDTPKCADELLNACKRLKDAGYIPMQGNPGMFAQRLLYPYVCNIIANSDNYQETYKRVNNCEDGVSELFTEPMKFMYELTENYYYDYKYVEKELKMFTDNSDEGVARYFFNIIENNENFAKKDDIGSVAFMPGTLSQQSTMDKIKEDYHSNIDYEFILSPVSNDGGFAYVSPSKGIAINKNSHHTDWSIEFINYLFAKENNIEFSKNAHYIPNIKNSFGVIKKQFSVPSNRISDLGQATFDYPFYSIIEDTLINISKANNPKYMNTDKDGNPEMYSFDYYMNQLENEFSVHRK